MDEIDSAPGRGAELRERYARDYAPAARRCGMTLEASWQTPIAEDPERSATFYYAWSVPDVAGWWAARLARDEAKTGWWEANAALIATRRRRFLTDIEPAGAA